MDSCFGYLTEERIERLSDNSCKRIIIDVSFSSLHKVMLVKGLNLNNCFIDMTLAVCVNTELHSSILHFLLAMLEVIQKGQRCFYL